MSEAKVSEIILIRENAMLPSHLRIDSEAFMPGWRMIKNLDGYALGEKFKQSNWKFEALAGEKRARVLGRGGQLTLMRGIKRILSELQGRRFNSLEITVVRLNRFLGMTYMSLSANRRHIQDMA